ncbi:MAG: hypothetical protein J1E79_06340 [Rikenella sp.]|nr:hypothetical protein [Rikenella sp.]
MDNNLLKQLIARHRRVVIPDFGAFLKKETPEGEALVFSPFLRKDDGVVTNAIVREYGVETEDARAMVSEFVIYLRQSLASSGKYYIEGIGMLAADANGSITLREGEKPEPEPVEPEPVQPPQQTARMQQPVQQPIVQQPVAPQQAIPQPIPPMTQQQPAMPRPQSIQMQGQVPPMPQQPQPAMQPQQPMRGPMMMGGQQQPLQPQQPSPFGRIQQQPGPGQQPGQPMRNGSVQQRPAASQHMAQPQMGQLRTPAGGGAAMPGQQQTVGMLPQQPLQQGQPTTAGGVRTQTGLQQRPNGGQGGGRPGMGSGPHPGRPGGQGPRRPGQSGRRKQPKTKTDIWLVVAIIAALVVIAIMIYGLITKQGEMDMEFLNTNMAPATEETID